MSENNNTNIKIFIDEYNSYCEESNKLLDSGFELTVCKYRVKKLKEILKGEKSVTLLNPLSLNQLKEVVCQGKDNNMIENETLQREIAVQTALETKLKNEISKERISKTSKLLNDAISVATNSL